MSGLKYIEHPTAARIVHLVDMENFISFSMEKWYDLPSALGGSLKPGQRFAFDLRSVEPSVDRARKIGSWVNDGGEQPSVEEMLSNLVVGEKLTPGTYVVGLPSVDGEEES